MKKVKKSEKKSEKKPYKVNKKALQSEKTVKKQQWESTIKDVFAVEE